MKQIRVAILSNAGGSGKTTTAVHIAYELARRNKSVALFDLDPNQSLQLFTGTAGSDESLSLAALLPDLKVFKGDYPLLPCWTEYTDKVDLIPGGGQDLIRLSSELVINQRGSYLLADCLEDYPLPHQVYIYDCPATIGTLTSAALAASTHILVPIQSEPKAANGASLMLQWFYEEIGNLRLRPAPEILGVIINRHEHSWSYSREIEEGVPRKLAEQGIHTFSTIREYADFMNASSYGIPLQIYRPGHQKGNSTQGFAEIADAISRLLQ
jgi:chromosome partitioning protein